MQNSITFVTALFDIGRDDLSEGFSRSFDHYKESFSKLLKVDANLVIYCDPKLESFIWEYRNKHNTKVITDNNLEKFPFFNIVQKIRNEPTWYKQAGWLEESPQAKLELYNPLVLSKQFMLHDASIYNFFDSNYYFWIDAGITNTLNIDYLLDEDLKQRLFKLAIKNKMIYLAFPYDGKYEVHGFEKSEMNKLAGEETTYVCRGGFFGGSKDVISKINSIYYDLLYNTLKNGYMGTEESLFTILSYKHPDLCNIQSIESNGLIYKFFEDLKKIKIEKHKYPIAFYILTYNAPEQLKLVLNSFKEYFKNDLSKIKLYLINNTTNENVKEGYDKLIEEYDLEEHKFDNIGINSARFWAAQHFNDAPHEYMLFFEDDMALNKENKHTCKNGFNTYHKNLIETSIEILEENELDYIKLSFSEVFGDNHTNWAWYNLDDTKRKEYLNDEKRTKIFYSGTHKKLPYLVGEFYYCNWPLLFNKAGNRKVFLETIFDHEYEQTWMANTARLFHENKIKAGCLLLTPILHKRIKHYGSSSRKENKHN